MYYGIFLRAKFISYDVENSCLQNLSLIIGNGKFLICKYGVMAQWLVLRTANSVFGVSSLVLGTDDPRGTVSAWSPTVRG